MHVAQSDQKIIRIKSSRRRKFFVLLLLSIIPILLWQVKNFHAELQSEFVVDDFVTYWSSGRLLLAGDNPYSSPQLLALQKSVGWTRETPLLTYNPPWGMPFVLPFCLQDYLTAKMLWLSFNFLLIFLSLIFFMKFYLGAKKTSTWSLLFAFNFAPILFALKKGQIIPFVLLGVVCFLYFEKSRKMLLAGFATILISIKPHVAFLFWPALLYWTILNRRWFILVGAVSAGLVSTIIAINFNQNILAEYLNHLIKQSPLYDFATPSLGTLLRVLFGTEQFFLQFLPSILGFLWIIYYVRKHGRNMAWRQEMPLILLVSIMTSYYVWVNDYILLLPAIIHGFGLFLNRRNIFFWGWPILAYILIYCLAWITPRNEFCFLWMPPIIFAVYIAIIKQTYRHKYTVIN